MTSHIKQSLAPQSKRVGSFTIPSGGNGGPLTSASGVLDGSLITGFSGDILFIPDRQFINFATATESVSFARYCGAGDRFQWRWGSDRFCTWIFHAFFSTSSRVSSVVRTGIARPRSVRIRFKEIEASRYGRWINPVLMRPWRIAFTAFA